MVNEVPGYHSRDTAEMVYTHGTLLYAMMVNEVPISVGGITAGGVYIRCVTLTGWFARYRWRVYITAEMHGGSMRVYFEVYHSSQLFLLLCDTETAVLYPFTRVRIGSALHSERC